MAETSVASAAPPSRRFDSHALFAAAAYLALWFVTFRQLSLEWSVNSLYAYGYAIPLFSGYLIWERWPSRPAPRPGHWPAALWVVPFAILLGYAPLRLIAEANPDWLLLNWALAGIAVSLTFLGLFLAGGWPWCRYFGFPVLFTFTAVAWPVSIENLILQNLMSSNAAITADLLTLCGIPAMALGNVIEIGAHTVGVEEACSGIRSLQTAFMMSLFMGEYFRLDLLRRLFLVASSFGLAFILNLGRTIVLTYVGGMDGPEALEKLHDPLGYIVLILCLVGLIALAFWMRPREAANGGSEEQGAGSEETEEAKNKEQRAESPDSGKASETPRSTLHAPSSSPPLAPPSPPAKAGTRVPDFALPPLAWCIAILTVGLIAEFGTNYWYASRERGLPPAVDWGVSWPESAKKFTRVTFAERTKTILKFNEGDSATWYAPSNHYWTLYYLRWLPGRVAQNLAGAHTPDICLPASGYKMVSAEGTTVVDVNGLQLPFRRYIFESGAHRMYVFHCIVDDRPTSAAEALVDAEPLSRESRLRNTLEGRRNLGQRVVGISISGPESLASAERELQSQLLSLIRTPTNTTSK